MTINQLFNVVEIKTKIVSLSTFLLALFYVIQTKSDFSMINVLLVFVSMLLIDMGTTGFNTYYDYISGVDHLDHNREKDKILLTGQVQPFEVQMLSIMLFAIAILLGFLLVLRSSPLLIPVGMICLCIAFFYSGGPVPISATAVGEFFAGIAMGTLLFLIIVFSLIQKMNAELILLSLPSSFMIASILAVNNACDAIQDKRAGRRTFAIVFGPLKADLYIYVLWGLTALSWCALILLEFLSIWSFFCLILFIVFYIVSIRQYKKCKSSELRKPLSMTVVIKLFMLYTIGFGISIILPI